MTNGLRSRLDERPVAAQGTQLQHGLAIGFLKILQLLLVLLADVEWVRPQGILHPPLRVSNPPLNHRGRQAKDRLASATVVLP